MGGLGCGLEGRGGGLGGGLGCFIAAWILEVVNVVLWFRSDYCATSCFVLVLRRYGASFQDMALPVNKTLQEQLLLF